MRARRYNPSGWADWEAFKHRLGKRFIAWAEPPPRRNDEARYAVIEHNQSIVWARVSPNPDVPYEKSSGAFYDEDERGKRVRGGAVAWAKRAARQHKKEYGF